MCSMFDANEPNTEFIHFRLSNLKDYHKTFRLIEFLGAVIRNNKNGGRIFKRLVNFSPEISNFTTKTLIVR